MSTPHAAAALAHAGRQSPLPLLALGALGVVFGDIGTSPLYALKECFSGTHGAPLTPPNLLGVLSLLFWALALVVSTKYVAFVMRADNEGEGGILALLALVQRLTADRPRFSYALAILGVFGATLFYGDAIITPAISVLSAVEGVGVLAPRLSRYVVPITVGVLTGLFLIQRHGTARVGALFGPLTLVWFLTLGTLGAVGVAGNPSVLTALNPLHGVMFLVEHPGLAFVVLGAVVLAVTGTEALYADMGHFGVGPIRLGWFAVVWPALTLNYFGQGALLLADSGAVQNPFYLLAPAGLRPALVALATVATIIASQAVISGAFSLTQQAIRLGYLPRLRIRHTSAAERGQIYIPAINWMLLAGVLLLVIGFRSSSGLAAAYGIAVTGAMLVDSLLIAVVMALAWRWPLPLVGTLLAAFLVVDLGFLSANAVKVVSGGWLPLGVALALFVGLTTWRRGRQILAARLQADTLGLDEFLRTLRTDLPRVPGTAVFMTGNSAWTPSALVQNLVHNKVLHERVVLVTMRTADVPWVHAARRVQVQPREHGFFVVQVTYGFMQQPHIPRALELCAAQGVEFDFDDTTFFLGRETVIPTLRPGMALWREYLFAWMMRNAGSAAEFFRLPSARVVELGSQIDI
ncbi:MAG: potassium transporter Kup [Pseudomonadota bacterium]